MRVVILGAKGFLGQYLQRLYPGADVPDVDITDGPAVGAMLDTLMPDVLFNAAGKTGRPNVDWCDEHKEETLHANVTGTLVLLHECQKRNVYWVHFSSGCIYAGDNGGKGYSEDDAPNFYGSYYSSTKAWSEVMLKDFPVLVLRPRMPFDGSLHPRNLIMKVCKYAKVLDEPNSVTYLPDMFAAIRQLVERRATGTYNVVNPGVTSPFAIMERYREIVDPQHRFERLPVERLDAVAKAGRSNCMLSAEKLRREGIIMRPIDEAVDEALRSIAAAMKQVTPAAA